MSNLTQSFLVVILGVRQCRHLPEDISSFVVS